MHKHIEGEFNRDAHRKRKNEKGAGHDGTGPSERESLPTQVEADDEEFNVKLSFYLPWVGRKIAGTPMINKQQTKRSQSQRKITNKYIDGGMQRRKSQPNADQIAARQ